MTKRATIGLMAHVDAGKTTLAEALLYQAGAIRQAGRVDAGTTFLDSTALEKQRGITIFDHQAELTVDDLDLTLLDTPGHVDFVPAVERVLGVLDAAVLVVSAVDGIQSHTRTLWRLLDAQKVPTFILINKLDQAAAQPDRVLAELQDEFGEACLPFNLPDQFAEWPAETPEALATRGDEELLDAYLTSGDLAPAAVRNLIRQRAVVPVYFASALKGAGVEAFLQGLARWVTPLAPAEEFAARAFKVSHDGDGTRLTWLRLLGGSLRAKQELAGEKVDQLRHYNGQRFSVEQEAAAGEVVVVAGPQATRPDQVFGAATTHSATQLSVLNYEVNLGDQPFNRVHRALAQLADEEPLLRLQIDAERDQLAVQLMGTVQKEVLEAQLREQFGLEVSLQAAGVALRETITAPVEGVGHFEPLRHYAEVHLRLDPLPAGSGIQIESQLREEVLPANWQHQVLTALGAKEHRGVQVGAPLTDVKLTLVGGRGNLKHTSGGDFRQAAWRAVRQGLMTLKAHGKVQVLEPWYRVSLLVPVDQVGRALSDFDRFGGELTMPSDLPSQGLVSLTGQAPVAQLQDYPATVRAYTHGQGQVSLSFGGFRPMKELPVSDYDPVRDLENPPGSVFCAHGAGYPVAWDQVPATMHCPWALPEIMQNLPVGS